MPGSFFDSNVLLYLLTGEPRKAERAADVLLPGGTVSVQILNEVTNVTRRKIRMPWVSLNEFLEGLRSIVAVTPLTIEVHDKGLSLAQRYGLSTFDAMIAASALMADCDRLWSEDMHHGLIIERTLTITNPFL